MAIFARRLSSGGAVAGMGLAIAGIGLAVAAVGAPAYAAAPDQPDLVVSATFDKSSYVLGDAATVTVTVKNVGAAIATNVHGTGGDLRGWDINTFPSLGFDVAPNDSVDFAITGTINADGHHIGHAFEALGLAADEADANPDDNSATAVARVVGGIGTLRGTVFHEADGDELTVDPIGVPGVKIALFDDFAPTVKVAEATTGADGTFVIANLPAASYKFVLTLPPGWALGGFHTTNGALVTDGDNKPVLISVVKVPVTATSEPPAASTPAPSTPAPTAPPVPARPALPETGSPVGTIVAAGLGAVAIGVLLVVVARRRRPATDRS